jgi:hypothetical protein
MRNSLIGKKASYKTSFTMIFAIFVLFLLSLSAFTVIGKYRVLKVDIDVDKNPLDCGEETTVTVTIHLERGDDIPSYGDLEIGLIENDGPNASTLDKESIWGPLLSFGENPVSFTVKCQIKEAGCQLWGPRGNSDESGAWVYAYIWSVGEKSPKIYIQCKQIEKDGEVSMNGSDSCMVGDETTAIMSAVEPINNVTSANWSISYDSSVFEVKMVEFLNPGLIDLFDKGLLTYQDNPRENQIEFSIFLTIEPITLEGELVSIELMAKNDTSKFWQETFLKCTEDSVFFSELIEEIDICKGGNHSIFILPFDTTPPEIDITHIDFTQGLVTGQPGAVTDENYGDLDGYLTVSLYDENDELVAENTINPDGSFELGPFFWLSNESSSTLIVTNGASLNTSYSFTPKQSNIPYVYALNDTTGEPGENITVQIYVQGRSDTSETYDILISDTQNWEFEQNSYHITLGAMEDRIILVNASIPKTAENGSTNTISLIMASSTNPEYSDYDSVNVNIVGEYIEPTKPSKKKDEIPGFEFAIVFLAVLIITLYISRRKAR